MAGFADLLGRNQPALGVNRAAYVAGDTWYDRIGIFKDNTGAPIDFTAGGGTTVTITILTAPTGGTVVATITGTAYNDGTFSFTVANSATGAYATSDPVRQCYWKCTLTNSSQTVTVWDAYESSFSILAN